MPTLRFEKVVDGFTHTVERECQDDEIGRVALAQSDAGYRLSAIDGLPFEGFCRVCNDPVAGGSFMVDGNNEVTHGHCIDFD